MEVSRRGVSGYVEAFILIGVAMAGSGMVLDAAMKYASSAQGPSLAVSDAEITQGSHLAVESLALFNDGSTPSGSITVSTVPVASAETYCYSILDPTTRSVLGSTCPSMAPNFGEVVINPGLAPGGSELLQLVVVGKAFAVGSTCTVTVTSSAGAQQTLAVEVVPA